MGLYSYHEFYNVLFFLEIAGYYLAIFAFYWDNLGSFIYMEVYNFNHNKLEGGNYFE